MKVSLLLAIVCMSITACTLEPELAEKEPSYIGTLEGYVGGYLTKEPNQGLIIFALNKNEVFFRHYYYDAEVSFRSPVGEKTITRFGSSSSKITLLVESVDIENGSAIISVKIEN